MNKTKQKILSKALELYNMHGISTISIRQIAQEVNISHSNLLYHFPSQQDIVLALHELLLDRAKEINSRVNMEEFSFIQLYDTTKMGFSVVYDYRFLFNDLLYICSSFPEMRKTLIYVEKIRSEMYRGVISFMIDKKIMRKEEYKDEYQQLFTHIKIYSDHWIVSSSIYDELSVEEKIEKYANLFMAFFYPYLTSEGKEEYKKTYLKMPD